MALSDGRQGWPILTEGEDGPSLLHVTGVPSIEIVPPAGVSISFFRLESGRFPSLPSCLAELGKQVTVLTPWLPRPVQTLAGTSCLLEVGSAF